MSGEADSNASSAGAGLLDRSPVIHTEGLTKHYGDAVGIEDLDLDVMPGEIFGYLGPNGAGKTTTLRLLLDFIRPTRGGARILGMDCRRDSVAIRRRVGYLPGEFALYDHMSGRQLVEYFGDLRSGLDASAYETVADRLGCDLDRSVGDLSHGNKQKVGIVQALMGQPELLILDEPTTGLDPLVQQEFYALLRERRERGCTVLFSSHNLAEVERLCDRVGIVREGRLVTVEDVAALKKHSVRKVEIRFGDGFEMSAFERLEGVSRLRAIDDGIACTVRGGMTSLLAAAQRFRVVDLLSREASLEEIFLELYGGPSGGEGTGDRSRGDCASVDDHHGAGSQEVGDRDGD